MPAVGYDADTGEYVGPCPKCGTDHNGLPGPETIGGAMECLRVQSAALCDAELTGRIALTQTWMRVAQANGLGLPIAGLD